MKKLEFHTATFYDVEPTERQVEHFTVRSYFYTDPAEFASTGFGFAVDPQTPACMIEKFTAPTPPQEQQIYVFASAKTVSIEGDYQ